MTEFVQYTCEIVLKIGEKFLHWLKKNDFHLEFKPQS